MAEREGGPRPGGRSARVQASVHRATRDLLARMDRAAVTIPLVAAEAGVTPSTIYRRWGELNDLLADVAVERLRPDMVPVETGSGRGDLLAWAEQYAEEMASQLGREMIRDVLAADGEAGPRRCCGYARQQIAVIAERAAARGEAFPDLDRVLDRVIAPILFRILFDEALVADRVGALVENAFSAGAWTDMARISPLPAGGERAADPSSGQQQAQAQPERG
ncbi:TetR/AcrR family transcriptional regulator [Methylobacterium sp. SyP6R]|uniref:TetR/AcrR family transcriptional regulator n=1 Tax=Methylobacterium sp. SyP6R TaxID=2718876 RepID=UPI003FA56511